jgi:hypothetical protein
VSQPQSVAIAGAISNQDLSYEGQLNKVSSPAEPRELRVGSKQLVERDREVALVGEQRASNPDASVASARLEPGVNQSKGSISIAELARAGELIQMVAKSEEEAKLLVQDLEVINSEVLIQSSEAEQLEITSDEHQQSKAGSKGRLKAAAKNISDERIRQLIIQQLLNQAFDQARRDRMLRMLLALGISESEYMALLGKLEMIEAERVTEATTEALLNEVDHSDKQAAEVEPSVTAKPGMENHEPIELPRRNLTRADLYQRLKQSDASDSE